MKVSIIMPYWDRQRAADMALELFASTYPDLEAEIIVVDDGNKVPFVVSKHAPELKVLRLPPKDKPTPQSTTWNRAVEFATGDVIVLNCIEVLHNKPVLIDMLRQLEQLGPMAYVLASAWCPEHRKWHCHTSLPVPDCPPGVGIGFCGAMYRSLYELVGGFDEDYMQGAGYEDRDFVRRLVRAGAQFVVRNDLVVTHPKFGASIGWSNEGFTRNEKLFYQKWPKN